MRPGKKRSASKGDYVLGIGILTENQGQARGGRVASHLLSCFPLVHLLFSSYSPLVLPPFPGFRAVGGTALLPQYCFLLTAPQQKRSRWIRRFWRCSSYRPMPATVGRVTPCAPTTKRISLQLEQPPALTARTEWRALPSASLLTTPSTGRGRGPGSGPGRRGGWGED